MRPTFNRVIAGLDRDGVGLTFLGASPVATSYASLGRRVRGNAARFAAVGIGRGERVAIALETDLEHIVTVLALMAAGAIPVSVKPRRGSIEDYAADLDALVSRFGIRYAYRSLPPLAHATPVAWDAEATSDDAAAVTDVEPEDVAFIQFSSGSLGDPKAIPIRHESLMHNLDAITTVDARTADSIGYNFLPLSHDMGLVGGLLSNLVFQNALHLSPVGNFLRRPTDFFARVRRCDTVAMPDFALRYLVRNLAARARASDAELLSGMGTIFCGAEPIRYETIAALVEAAPKYGFDPRSLVFCYGMAEATLIVTARRFDTLESSFTLGALGQRIAGVGRPVAGTEIRVDPDGLIHVRGPSVFRGYAGAAAPPDGWHDTGDLGFERDGELYITGRRKDLVIINGENVFPGDIELFVSRLPGVAETLVMSDGDRFYVFVVAQGGAALDMDAISVEIGIHFGAVPAGITTGAAKNIARTTSGKPMRQAMLTELRAGGKVV